VPRRTVEQRAVLAAPSLPSARLNPPPSLPPPLARRTSTNGLVGGGGWPTGASACAPAAAHSCAPAGAHAPTTSASSSLDSSPASRGTSGTLHDDGAGSEHPRVGRSW
jgi:hypothetical protein